MEQTNQPKKSPDFSAEKSNLNLILAFVVFWMLFYFFDGFILHEIPAPASGQKFYLSTSDSVYADSVILYIDDSDIEYQTYLVEKDGELHLLHYEFHYVTRRGNLVGDVLVDPVGTHTYKVNTPLKQIRFTTADGVIIKQDGFAITNGQSTDELLVSGILAALLAFWENRLYVKRLKKKQNT